MSIKNRHYEDSTPAAGLPREVFDFIDNPNNLAMHMEIPSPLMGGGSVKTIIGAGEAKTIGSHIRMSGKAFGIPIFLDEAITRREPPRIKSWKTTGDINLVVIGHYEMTVKTEDFQGKSKVTGSINWQLPDRNKWLGYMFGGLYARWCIGMMLKSVRERFG